MRVMKKQFFCNVIFLKFYFKNFIQLRKTHAVNYLKKFITNFITLVKKNDVILPYKYGNVTRSEFYDIFACLVLASATEKTFVY